MSTEALGLSEMVFRLTLHSWEPIQGAHSTEAVLQHIGQTGPKAMCWSGPGLQTGPKARCWPVLCAAAHSQYWVLVWSGHPAHSYCHVLVCVPASTAHSLLPTPSLPNGVVNGKIVLIGDKHNRGTNTIFKSGYLDRTEIVYRSKPGSRQKACAGLSALRCAAVQAPLVV